MDTNYGIFPIRLGIVNAFVIKGASIVLVDTGPAKQGEKLVAELGKLGIQPKDLDLIILTHGHDDHMGALPFLKERTQAKALIHKHDMFSIVEGRNVPLHGRNRFVRFLLGLLSGDRIPDYTPVQPDIVVEDEYSLRDYGIPATVISTPGHTPGSISICFDHEAMTGDLIATGFGFTLIKMLMPKSDLPVLYKSIRRVLAYHPEKIYISHGDVCDYATVQKLIAGEKLSSHNGAC
jgi:glyoxylase-like metal-dependent hydrolase (beta-lactamase superfamily II)